ncbi:nickel-binding protein [Ramlibacter sp. PS4R-6]|uniref:nickel-binding protein n=1 Tax=Ramlibacter sp. PS4R-6 TaxID=3133438 RepID=UPI0030B3AE64
MPMYMDIHEVKGAKAEDVANAHMADMKVQGRYGVEYHKYWLNEASGKIFCLCSAPTAELASRVHAEAHGLIASKIIEVDPDVADGFLGGTAINTGGAAVFPATAEPDTGIRSILFTDIVNSTGITQRHGDDVGMQCLRLHDDIVRAALAEFHGREVKHTGDGIMASFASAASAVRAAAQIHEKLAKCDATPVRVQVRVGIAAGEPVERNQDLFGSTVQLAARLCAAADPSRSFVSGAVAELCGGKGLEFDYIGEVTLKGFEQPQRVHAAH